MSKVVLASENVFATVEQARRQLTAVQAALDRAVAASKNPSAGGPGALRNDALQILQTKVANADKFLYLAEVDIARAKDRLRTASILPPRPKEFLAYHLQATRALSVIDKEKGLITKKSRLAIDTITPEPFSAIEIEQFCTKAEDVHKDILQISYNLDSSGIHKNSIQITFPSAFKVVVWLLPYKKKIFESSPKILQNQDTKTENALYELEFVSAYAQSETPERLALSKYSVFHVLSERATMAWDYFHKSRADNTTTLETFLNWLAGHRKVFRDVSEEHKRHLAFDASRGVFLPPCVRAFEDKDIPCHARSSVPERSLEREKR